MLYIVALVFVFIKIQHFILLLPKVVEKTDCLKLFDLRMLSGLKKLIL